MNKNKKTIIIGAITTLCVLGIAILIFYLIYNNEKENIAQTHDPIDNIETGANTNNESMTETPTAEEQTNTSNPSNHEKIVTIYLFRGEGCPHCEHAMEFFKTLNQDYPYLRVIAYEVWYNEENRKLMAAVSNELGLEISTSVPLIIIGSDYNLRGYGEARNEDILQEITSAYQNENYEDIIEPILESNSWNVTPEEII